MQRICYCVMSSLCVNAQPTKIYMSICSLDLCVRRQWFPKPLLNINQSFIDDMQQHDIHNNHHRHFQEIFEELTRLTLMLQNSSSFFLHIHNGPWLFSCLFLPFNHLLTLIIIFISICIYYLCIYMVGPSLFQGICCLKMIIMNKLPIIAQHNSPESLEARLLRLSLCSKNSSVLNLSQLYCAKLYVFDHCHKYFSCNYFVIEKF